jgi:serine/threonine protein kinase
MTTQVQDPSSKEFKVVKFLPCEYDEDCERVVQECTVLADVTHPNVVRVRNVQRHLIQSFTLHGAATMRWHLAVTVSEWCPGGRLVDHLRRVDSQSISENMMQRWCQQAAAGLKAIHSLGICHRNLNPGNVYLDKAGKAKIGGFMCLKAARGPGCTFSHGRCDTGSPMCIAPEVDDGYEVTIKADVWALGCCMYYWTTGTLPDLRRIGVDTALRSVSLHFGERVRGAIRMALQIHPEIRSNAEDIWAYLSVFKSSVGTKRLNALNKLRGKIAVKPGINHGAKSGIAAVISQASQTNNKFKLKLLANIAAEAEANNAELGKK